MSKCVKPYNFLFLKDCICLLLREKGRKGERMGEKHQCVRDTSIGCLSHAPNWGTWPATQACALTGNQTCDLLVLRLALSPLSHTSQGQFSFNLTQFNTLLLSMYLTNTLYVVLFLLNHYVKEVLSTVF